MIALTVLESQRLGLNFPCPLDEPFCINFYCGYPGAYQAQLSNSFRVGSGSSLPINWFLNFKCGCSKVQSGAIWEHFYKLMNESRSRLFFILFYFIVSVTMFLLVQKNAIYDIGFAQDCKAVAATCVSDVNWQRYNNDDSDNTVTLLCTLLWLWQQLITLW